MTTATLPVRKTTKFNVTSTEAGPSDFEIARRVSEIKSKWSAQERMERRIEAELRFECLLEQLAMSQPVAA